MNQFLKYVLITLVITGAIAATVVVFTERYLLSRETREIEHLNQEKVGEDEVSQYNQKTKGVLTEQNQTSPSTEPKLHPEIELGTSNTALEIELAAAKQSEETAADIATQPDESYSSWLHEEAKKVERRYAGAALGDDEFLTSASQELLHHERETKHHSSNADFQSEKTYIEHLNLTVTKTFNRDDVESNTNSRSMAETSALSIEEAQFFSSAARDLN